MIKEILYICLKLGLVPVTRHVKIKAEANPFDPEWENYFETRYTRKWFCSKWGRSKLRRLWRQTEWLMSGLPAKV